MKLTPDERTLVPALPYEYDLVKWVSRWSREERTRLEWLLRQRVLVDLELRARYWRIGTGLRAKILTGIEKLAADPTPDLRERS